MQAQYIVLALMSANFVHGFNFVHAHTHAPVYHIMGYIRGGKFSQVELFPAFQVEIFHELSWIVE